LHDSQPNFYDDLNFLNDNIPPAPDPRWVLMAEGSEWRRDWQPSTFYNIGDLVKYGGIVYLCTEGHTSVDSSDNFYDDLSLSYWTVQVSSDNWVTDWTTSTFYKLNDIARYGGIVYRCTEGHISDSTDVTGLEIDQDKWEIVNLGQDWKGDWTTSNRYKVNDIVRYGGIVYRCTEGHESSATSADGLEDDSDKWSVFVNGVEYVGNYVAEGYRYKANDIVKYGSYLYQVTVAHTSREADGFLAGNFSIYCPGQEFDNEWNEDTVYQIGDIVRYGGYLFVNRATGSGIIPTYDTAQPNASWTLLFENSNVRGEWGRTSSYRLGDVVRRSGQVFVAVADSIGEDPDILTDDSTVNSDYWDLIIPGEKWVGIWGAGNTYVEGDVVVLTSSSYRALRRHVSDAGNSPEDDGGFYWEPLILGDPDNVLKEVGDILSYGVQEDGSSIGNRRITIGNEKQTLAVQDSDISWKNLNSATSVFFVANDGVDSPNLGRDQNAPWKTLRYALEYVRDNVSGNSTIYVRTGIFDEVLPLTVPAFCAVVGDELRSTVIRPTQPIISDLDLTYLIQIIQYFQSIVEFVVLEQEIGTADELQPTFGTNLYSNESQVFLGSPSTDDTATNYSSLLGQLVSILNDGLVASVNSTNTASTDEAEVNAYNLLVANRSFILAELKAYITTVQPLYDYNETQLDSNIARVIDAIIYDTQYPGNYRTGLESQYFLNANSYDRNKIQNMFLLRDGTGLRNCTLTGLSGTLGDLNANLTRRPTAGAYASLDPGWGTQDDTVWVGSKSPYVQNVTTFGDGCIGLKIDGDLHAGGNQTIVSNDFTQILSDGIGVWCNGTGKTEAVSVFTYYNHIGYLCTRGGKIRGTNGNCSYGTFGAVAEGFNVSEAPIQASVNNRYFEADVASVQTKNQEISKLFFSNAGNEYTSATFTVSGSGLNQELLGDEIRDDAVYEVRITDPGDSGIAGGAGYKFTTNSAQAGTDKTITIAAADEEVPATYREMRVYIQSGTGAGQYGYVAEYDDTSKIVYVGDEYYPKKTVLETQAIGNLVVLDSTEGLSIGDPVIFTGTHYGNIQETTIYYVNSVSGSNITISTSPDKTGYTLSNAVSDSITLNTGGTPRGIVFNDIGTKAFVLEGGVVTEYFMYDNFNIESATAINTFDSGLNTHTGLTFNATGTKLYFANETTGLIYEHDLSVAYDVTSIDPTPATYDANAVSSIDPTDVLFNNSGSKMYIVESTVASQQIHQYSLSTEFDITTATDDSIALDTALQTTNDNLGGAYFNDDGTKIFVNDSDAVYRYGLSASFDLSSASYDSVTYDFSGTVASAIGAIEFANSGEKMYITAGSTSTIYQFSTVANTAFGLINETGDMELHHLGWNNINPGTPAETTLNTTTNYTIEPRVTFSSPGYSVNSATMYSSGSGNPFTKVIYADGQFVAIAGGTTVSTAVGTSDNGVEWTFSTLPASARWKSIAYGNGNYIAVGDGVSAISTDGISWALAGAPSLSYTGVAYGDGVWIAVASGGDTAVKSTDDGDTWTTITLPSGSDWSAITYGKGKFVAIAESASSNTESAYSADGGDTWTESSMPGGAYAITFGNNRFVAIEGGFEGSNNSFISFDGETWVQGNLPTADNWQDITYGQGLFVAVAEDSGSCAVSEDGIRWESETLSGSSEWSTVAFGNSENTGRFIVISRNTGNRNPVRDIRTGVRAQARVSVVGQRISAISIWEPGSGYGSAPAFVLTDPNNTGDVAVNVRTHHGVLGNPTLVNAGTGFQNNTTFVTITGDGFKDQFQTGSDIIVSGLTRIPGPGDNVNFDEITDYTYKLLSVTVLEGEFPNVTARLTIAKDLDRDESPGHGDSLEIRQQYSQVRLSGHDFLDIGLGNFVQTNYPNVLFPIGTVRAPQDEVIEADGGRVFYTSTDQNGNFRVGELFAVEQSTGIVTINADFFDLEGLEELVLGGVSVGGSGVVVREFSTDPTFTADSNNIIPTQRAIKAFITARVSGGGSDAITGQMTAGVVTMGPNQFTTTTGVEINVPVKMTFQGGIDGVWLQQSVFLSGNNE